MVVASRRPYIGALGQPPRVPRAVELDAAKAAWLCPPADTQVWHQAWLAPLKSPMKRHSLIEKTTAIRKSWTG